MAFQIGDKYYHEDIESGEIVEISKAVFDSMNHWRQKIESMIDPNKKIKGTITIISTMANGEDGENPFYDLWKDNQQNK
jgi:hypothetical protein